MHTAPSFSFMQIKQKLNELNISFTIDGNVHHEGYTFKSLRNIEKCGIYYVVPDISTPLIIEDSIILCQDGFESDSSNVFIRVVQPKLAYYSLMSAVFGKQGRRAGIHPTAIVDDQCEIDSTAYIGPYCVLENCIVEAHVNLHSHVAVMAGSVLQKGVTVEPHSTIGATGVAWVWDTSSRRRIVQPQIGYTIIGSGSFLGSDVTVVRGSINETTSIGEGCVIAHGSKIGHGSQVGAECHFANNVSIAGNVTLGKQCFLGSGAVIRPQVKLAERTVVGAGAVVVKNLEEVGMVLVGSPAKPIQTASEKMSGVPTPLDV